MIKPSDVLQEMEWIQGKTYKYTGNHNTIIGCCMVGAIYTAYAKANDEERSVCLDRLTELCDSLENISTWNDAPGRTKQEVVDKLREYGM